MKKINVTRTETVTLMLTYRDIEVPDDYQRMDAVEWNDYIDEAVGDTISYDEQVIDVIATAPWKEAR
jgi:hypothetical protein